MSRTSGKHRFSSSLPTFTSARVLSVTSMTNSCFVASVNKCCRMSKMTQERCWNGRRTRFNTHRDRQWRQDYRYCSKTCTLCLAQWTDRVNPNCKTIGRHRRALVDTSSRSRNYRYSWPPVTAFRDPRADIWRKRLRIPSNINAMTIYFDWLKL